MNRRLSLLIITACNSQMCHVYMHVFVGWQGTVHTPQGVKSLRVLFHQTLNVDTGRACTSAPHNYQPPLSAETKVKILMVRM